MSRSLHLGPRVMERCTQHGGAGETVNAMWVRDVSARRRVSSRARVSLMGRQLGIEPSAGFPFFFLFIFIFYFLLFLFVNFKFEFKSSCAFRT